MKPKDYNEKLEKMTLEELNEEIDDLKTQLLRLRFQQVTTYMENPVQLRLLKRDIARVKTVINRKSKEA
ncbi:MAG: 50S ribosomal protein L29 [Clostridia bacterium]|nr:50S ribosomal protein L29 [Clostridia bacterium]